MTREDAKKGVRDLEKLFLIDKIYDDFESRTCENCKWYRNQYCIEDEVGIILDNVVLKKHFSCNKFKRKEL